MAKRNTLFVDLGFIVVCVHFVTAETLSQETLSGRATVRARSTGDLISAGQKETGRRIAMAPCRSRPGMAPEMVLIEAASFMMGSPKEEAGRDSDEAQHPVTLQRGYAIGRCEVTIEEYRLFVAETGYKTQGNRGEGCRIWSESKAGWTDDPSADRESPGFTQNGDHPVVCVNWNDAKQYARWLSLRTNSGYRLPSEAEWEYAARGTLLGDSLPYHWGENPDEACQYANGADLDAKKQYAGWTVANCSDGYVYTASVGHYGSNGFGLYDTSGNVWEWTEDCWHDSYEGAPEDGLPWGEEKGGDCSRRVVRGGGWLDEPRLLRSAVRGRNGAGAALNDLGFRLARDL